MTHPWDGSAPRDRDRGRTQPRASRRAGGRITAPRSTLPFPPRYLAKLSSVGSISEEETCEKLKGLIQRQVQMCKRNLEVMDSVRRGAQLAIEECQYQFRNRRWNCSTLDSLPVFGKVVTQGEGGARGRRGGASGACARGGVRARPWQGRGQSRLSFIKLNRTLLEPGVSTQTEAPGEGLERALGWEGQQTGAVLCVGQHSTVCSVLVPKPPILQRK